MNYRIIAIALSAALSRGLYYLALRPEWVGDSGGYSTNSYNIAHGFVISVNGDRTPVYPLFLNLTQWLAGSPNSLLLSWGSMYVTCLLQAAFGIISALLIYDLLNNLGCSKRMSTFWAIAFGLIGDVIIPELQILPQAPESFLLVLSCWLLERQFRSVTDSQRRPRYFLWINLASGVVFSLCVLTRPDSIIFLGGLLCLLLGWSALLPAPFARPWRRRWYAAATMMALGSAPLIGAWMSFNYFNQGYFTLTTLRGSVQASALRDMFDRVGPEDKLLGDIVNQRYLQVKAEKIYWPDYITSAWPKILEKSNEMPIPHREAWHLGPDLNEYMGKVCLKLIKKYPFDWLRNAAESFIDTFYFVYPAEGPGSTDTVDKRPSVRSSSAFAIVDKIQKIEAPMLTVIYIFSLLAMFTLAGKGILFCVRARRASSQEIPPNVLTDMFAASVGLATVGAFIGYTLFACYLARYGASYLGPLFVCAGYSFHRLWNRRGDFGS